MRIYRIFPFILFFLLLGSHDAHTQTKKTREELEREKAEVQARLREFDAILKQTSATKQTSLGELNALTRQFQTQNRLVNTLDREVRLINQEISETEKKIIALETQLKDLKAEYSRMIYNSSKLNRGLSIVAFVFSSGNFNQLYMRLKYLKQYSDSRKQQAEQIEKLSAELGDQRALLDKKKADKIAVLSEEQKERAELERLRKSQQGVVNTLSRKERDIQRQITATKKQQEQLNRMIKQVIEEEIRRAEAEANKANSTTTKKAGTSMPMTPEAAALSSSFAGNKGKLPWPVETGFVSQGYGTYPHPTLKGIVQDSDGLEIRTQANSNVRSVFDGTVSKISTIPGYGLTVIIKHGEYFTMYSRLKNISVKVGQSVKAKETIGQVAANADGQSEVHFQTWKGLQIMDPATWITSK
ncbi:murein hydrolase activator EnvC family protein [Algoriphagus boritolerans]|uniref:Septal ring factor EnvC, activator of murein hydrolases AmiA and AmiB n=2 Tax=Algoriphagus TaxID=246875 RepID=A0A1H5X6C6_9BACT|nr:peptidoglycan DD-metalloendopeptidase family protein [Algoriphagus boritolerans]SEG07173.1 Septal ring factor EnvC, activator of murein hydrolases AmiA and AmiB [Algoriphagus boritolerans DSM 17298 = JCM 18970]